MPTKQIYETVLSLIKNASSILELTVEGRTRTSRQDKIFQKAVHAETAPELAFTSTALADFYIAIAIDVDAPLPSFGVLGPILHWIQPGLKPERIPDGKVALKASGAPFVADYIGPAPPPLSPAHRYIFLLYEQPADFEAKKYAPARGANLGNWLRMRHNLAAREKEAKLGPVIAANYFRSK